MAGPVPKTKLPKQSCTNYLPERNAKLRIRIEYGEDTRKEYIRNKEAVARQKTTFFVQLCFGNFVFGTGPAV